MEWDCLGSFRQRPVDPRHTHATRYATSLGCRVQGGSPSNTTRPVKLSNRGDLASSRQRQQLGQYEDGDDDDDDDDQSAAATAADGDDDDDGCNSAA